MSSGSNFFKKQYMADFIIFLTIILLTLVWIAGIIMCVRLIAMSVRNRSRKDILKSVLWLLVLIVVFFVLFSSGMVLRFCLSFLNKYFDVWGYSHI